MKRNFAMIAKPYAFDTEHFAMDVGNIVMLRNDPAEQFALRPDDADDFNMWHNFIIAQEADRKRKHRDSQAAYQNSLQLIFDNNAANTSTLQDGGLLQGEHQHRTTSPLTPTSQQAPLQPSLLTFVSPIVIFSQQLQIGFLISKLTSWRRSQHIIHLQEGSQQVNKDSNTLSNSLPQPQVPVRVDCSLASQFTQ